MRLGKTVLVGVAALASLTLATGCSNDKGGTTSTPSTSAAASPTKSSSANDQFVLAASLLRGTPYKFDMKDNTVTYTGTVNPLAVVTVATAKATIQGATITIDTQLSQSDYFAKISGMPVPGLDSSKWLHIDPAKLDASKITSGTIQDPTGLQALAKGATSVDSTDGKTFKGAVDLTKSPLVAIDAATVTALGDKAKAVPFEATADDKGRITSVKVTVPAAGSSKENVITVTYSDFGTAPKVDAPAAADVAEAPALVYTLLGG